MLGKLVWVLTGIGLVLFTIGLAVGILALWIIGLLMTLVGIATLFGIGVLAVGAAIRAKRHRRLSNRISDGVAHAIQRVDAARTPSLARQTFERLILTVVTFAASELAKRAAKNAADGRFPGGRLAT